MEQNRGITKFALKLLLFLVPFVFLIVSFMVIDPFMVVKKYDHYSGALVGLNADVVSTEMYLKNKQHNHYNSFIFGNSRTMAYKTPEWKKYLELDAKPFVYMAFNESLFGLVSKMKFVDQQKDSIKNALFIIDGALLERTSDRRDFYFNIKDPRPAGTSYLQFYYSFFKAYLSDFFFVKCIDYSIFGKKRKYMNGALDNEYIYFDPVTNDLYPMGRVTSRKMDSAGFYREFRKKSPAMSRVLKTDKKTIFAQQEKILLEIKQILDKNKTKFKIVISPKYDCYAINSEDIEKLQKIFGKENVYNFSGVNKYTTNIHSFYEAFHYTIETGESILKDIYSKESQK